MKALILDGSRKDDLTGERVFSALEAEMQLRSWEVEHILLREKKIGNCAGDMFCWIRTPGICNINDDNRRIAQAFVGCDLLVYLTPATFGGYSSELKRAVDHMMQNSLPFFKVVEGEIHHPQRYDHFPKLLAIGWVDTPQPEQENIFHCLVRHNAIGKQLSSAVSGVVYADRPDEDLVEAVSEWVKDIENGKSSPRRDLPALPEAHLAHTSIRNALLLTGSPRGRKSTSQAMGGYLFEQLEARGVQVETIQLYPALGSPERIQSLLAKIDGADLTVLAFPLYVDSLPGAVTRGLELIAGHRTENSPHQSKFAVIVNSGFPEASQNNTALAICATFARQAGFTWAGGLALGAGEAIVHGRPPDELGRSAASIRAALDLAAQSLANGEAMPEKAVALMAKPHIPKGLFILAGGIAWRLRTRKYGVMKSMLRQPYQV